MLGVELGEARAVEDALASAPASKPAVSSNSVSSAALSSRVWNGLIGVSRPGEKVIRLGVDISKHADWTQHPQAFGDELWPGPTGAR